MKKLLCVLLAAIMVLSMAAVASAEEKKLGRVLEKRTSETARELVNKL